jgi:hypothetical protein
MRFKCLAGVAFCVFLVGCDEASLMKKFTPAEDEAAARGYVELLRQGKYDQIQRDLDPSIVDSSSRDTLIQMAAIIPTEDPESVKVIGAHTNRGPGSSTTDLTLEYQFPSRWLLVNVVIRKTGGVSTITGFHVTALADSIENLNKFTLVGKSANQYLTLTIAVGCLVFTFYVLVLCIRTKDIRRKWLWIIIVLVGVGKFAINWSTGQTSFTPFAIQIPCFSAIRALYGQWTIAAHFPLGAVIFLKKRAKLQITGETIPQLEENSLEKPAGV